LCSELWVREIQTPEAFKEFAGRSVQTGLQRVVSEIGSEVVVLLIFLEGLMNT
jgi:hypothetical protein